MNMNFFSCEFEFDFIVVVYIFLYYEREQVFFEWQFLLV